ncbi:sugar phosphate isomerase/epimerase [Devosia sp.]|uniref:sugar phosphate isomerase/epimerase family protein n=1 Tax=Devosia sp. TaxID=1871048 RepID=UPI0032672AFA
MDMSFQLYSGRNTPIAEVLKIAAAAGYKYVEGYGGLDASTKSGLGGLYGDLETLKAQLDANGLSMPSAHIGLDLVESPDQAIKLANALGIKVLICPWLHPDMRPTDAAGWTAFGKRLAKAAEPLVAAGLTFGYHNHDFEFTKLPDGRFPMDVLLEAAPNISIEADIAWIVRGNADPFAWLEKFGQRIVAVHVKDIAPAGQNLDEDGWADVGHGKMAWKDLLDLVKTKTTARYFVAEHDNPSDLTRFATRSIATVKSFGV